MLKVNFGHSLNITATFYHRRLIKIIANNRANRSTPVFLKFQVYIQRENADTDRVILVLIDEEVA